METCIQMRPHLAAFLQSYYRNYRKADGALQLPPDSVLYHLVYERMQRRPAGVSPVDRGNLRLCLPCPRHGGKKPATYNYLSPASVTLIERHTDTLLNYRSTCCTMS